MAPRKKPPVRSQYFGAIKEQKLESLRWCLRHGGMSVRAENDDGYTGVQIAAASGYVNSLTTLVEHIQKVGEPSDLEEVDEDGRTPLMMAAHNGKLECVRVLVLRGKVGIHAKCEAGKTARDYATARRHDKLVAFLDNPKEPEPEEEAEEEEEQNKPRVFKASVKVSNAQAIKQEEVHKSRVEAADALQAALAAAPAASWPEVEVVLKETRRELSLRGKAPLAGEAGPLDPALFNCVCLQELRLEIADKALTSLPAQIALLDALTTLIVSNNALTALPDAISALSRLRNLEAASNQISSLPPSMSGMVDLQVIDLSSNQLSSISPLTPLVSLVSLKLGHNQIAELPLQWDALGHLNSLAVPNNALREAPAGLGELQMLVSLDLGHNQIEQIPIELGKLNVKKLQSVQLAGNPLADARIRRFVQQDEPTLVKDLLNHVRKNGYSGGDSSAKKGGGKKGKKGKKSATPQDVPGDDDDKEDVADLLASLMGGSDED